MRKRVGDVAKDMLRKGKGKPKGKAPVGQPGTDQEFKVTLTLPGRQVTYLDDVRTAIRRETGQVVYRVDFIRAYIDALADSGLDLTGCGTVDELKALLSSKLGR